MAMHEIPDTLVNPPPEFGVMPFWFWNDALDTAEIRRQIADFDAHGVTGFIIHPRVGLPWTLPWMSDALLSFYDVAIDEAKRRGMYVVLYDEGMYPSGSSAGQVVEADPDFHCRCLARIELDGDEPPALEQDQNLVAVVPRRNGQRIAVIDRKARSFIRGLHYDRATGEHRPPAADLLNPDAMAQFIRCVYDVFAKRFGEHFGNTIAAIFTDEPGLLAKCVESTEVRPGTTGILEHINRILGYDFTPHLPALWYDDEPDAGQCRDRYSQAIHSRLNETYYAQISAWCDGHDLPLTGHPAQSDELASLRYFNVPGQDAVWRSVLPDEPSAIAGRNSPQAKCTSSVMIHTGRRRNANECCGAYGHELTYEEMAWLANWCLVRGVNWLFPHAFYYSVRDGRGNERPPDVGPNNTWWDRYRGYADSCRRLCWLNTDGTHVCRVAILGKPFCAPWAAAKVCFENQIDFNYLEERHLWEDATVDADGVHLAGMHYGVVLSEQDPDPRAKDALAPLEEAGGVIGYDPAGGDSDLVNMIDNRAARDVRVTPATPGLRVRHVVKDRWHWLMLFNEVKTSADPCQFSLAWSVLDDSGQNAIMFNPVTGASEPLPPNARVTLAGHEIVVLGAQTD